jgi:hypothetical protein
MLRRGGRKKLVVVTGAVIKEIAVRCSCELHTQFYVGALHTLDFIEEGTYSPTVVMFRHRQGQKR